MLTSLVKSVLKVSLTLAVITAVGQIPVKGENVENRYHRLVNSDSFQKTFWTLARPVTWTGEKVSELATALRERATQASAR